MLVKTESNQEIIQARDRFERTRHDFNQAEKDHERREAQPFTPDKAGMDVSNAEQRMGRPMSAWSIQEKLQKIRPFLVFERSNADPTKTGIYMQSPTYDPTLYKGRLVPVCGMESGYKDGHKYMIPEFSVIVAETVEVPDISFEGGLRPMPSMKCELRGWRSVLAILMKAKILSAYDVEKHFQISLGRDSQRWQEVLEGRIELISQPTEELHGGTNERNQGEVDADGQRSAPRDDRPTGQLSGDPIHGGSIGDNATPDREGNAQARRCDAGEAGSGGTAPSGIDAADDCAGEHRNRQQEEHASAVQP